ncbi:MAG: primosomal protein N' [Ideonella sp.]
MRSTSPTPIHRLAVAVEAPQHSGLARPLDYLSERPLEAGCLVRVPLGSREVAGIVWQTGLVQQAADAAVDDQAPAPHQLRQVASALCSLPPLSDGWRALVEFSAAYYQRGIGEVALSVLPPELRKLDDVQLQRRLSKITSFLQKIRSDRAGTVPPALSPEQALVVEYLAAQIGAAPPAIAPTVLLHGSTGSGKTEVYLRAAADTLKLGRQALLLVPEINLTPQLESRFAERFADRVIVSLHSGLTPAQRLRNWLLAHLGHADLVLGTRLAIFASMPRLGLIVVDEEHDPSYKQQEGARYSARDLAVYRGRLEGATVLLGSATPSLESWQRAEEGRYSRLSMPARIGGAALPTVQLVDMSRLPKGQAPTVLSPGLLAALRLRVASGEQSLLFLNRRGYAPVLQCGECGWQSGCPNCSAWRVFHKLDRSLRCHHCGFAERVPRACPDCGNLDITPVGRGTERLEEQLVEALADGNCPPVRIARIDADSTRGQGQLESRLGAVHAGDVDILVGTQMITKGHDFRRMTLVAAVNPDSALFSSDFRAPERLFALLMQAAGRAGRDAGQAAGSEMWVQTWHARHPLYAALQRHDFAAFAAGQLAERRSAGLPPFSHLALLRADAKTSAAAESFLHAASDLARRHADAAQWLAGVSIYPPVPTAIARIANVERMQMLIESESRSHLQRFLAAWLPALHQLRRERNAADQRIVRWAIDVDPLAI